MLNETNTHSLVTLPKDVAEAIEYTRKVFGDEDLIKAHAAAPKGWVSESIALSGLPLMTLASALVNGYQVDEPPEDTVRKYYERCEEQRLKSSGYEYREYLAKSVAIKTTLKFLGIKIEGVNV